MVELKIFEQIREESKEKRTRFQSDLSGEVCLGNSHPDSGNVSYRTSRSD